MSAFPDHIPVQAYSKFLQCRWRCMFDTSECQNSPGCPERALIRA